MTEQRREQSGSPDRDTVEEEEQGGRGRLSPSGAKESKMRSPPLLPGPGKVRRTLEVGDCPSWQRGLLEAQPSGSKPKQLFSRPRTIPWRWGWDETLGLPTHLESH